MYIDLTVTWTNNRCMYIEHVESNKKLGAFGLAPQKMAFLSLIGQT